MELVEKLQKRRQWEMANNNSSAGGATATAATSQDGHLHSKLHDEAEKMIEKGLVTERVKRFSHKAPPPPPPSSIAALTASRSFRASNSLNSQQSFSNRHDSLTLTPSVSTSSGSNSSQPPFIRQSSQSRASRPPPPPPPAFLAAKSGATSTTTSTTTTTTAAINIQKDITTNNNTVQGFTPSEAKEISKIGKALFRKASGEIDSSKLQSNTTPANVTMVSSTTTTTTTKTTTTSPAALSKTSPTVPPRPAVKTAQSKNGLPIPFPTQSDTQSSSIPVQSKPQAMTVANTAATVAGSTGISEEQKAKVSDDDKHANKYFKAVFELVTSEFRYYLDLINAIKFFVQPLEQKFGVGFGRRIFSIWNDIAEFHEILLSRMMAEVTSCEQMIRASVNSDIVDKLNTYSSLVSEKDSDKIRMNSIQLDSFESLVESSFSLSKIQKLTVIQKENLIRAIDSLARSFASILKEGKLGLKTSVPYIANYPAALKFVEELAETKPQAQDFLDSLETNAFLKNLRLRDYLIKPVQRICKYPLLIREMIKYSKEAGTKSSLESCQEMLQDVADHVNAMIQKYEQDYEAKLHELRTLLKPSDYDKYNLFREDCKLIRISDLKILECIGSNVPSYLYKYEKILAYLFSNQLLLLDQSRNFIATYKLKAALQIDFNVDGPLEMEASPCTGHPGDENKFQVFFYHPEVSSAPIQQWTFSVKGKSLRDGWIADLSALTHQIKEAKRLKVLRSQGTR